MVPTEVLARQHFESITKMFETSGIDKKVVLITGSMTAKEKRIAYEKTPPMRQILLSAPMR